MNTVEQIKIVDEIAIKHGLEKLKSSKPRWGDRRIGEGIELHYNNFIPFKSDDGGISYDFEPSEKIKLVMEEINQMNGDVNEKQVTEDQKKTEQQQPKAALEKKQTHTCVLLPEEITKELLEKWKGMTTFDRLLMFQRTAPEYVEEKPKGKKKVKYVKGNIMQLEANVAFLFEWSDKIEGFHFSDQSVACYGSVGTTINGKWISHSAVGIDLQEYTRDTHEPVFSQEELMKNAHTDMIKKALSKFGFNGDVYRGEV